MLILISKTPNLCHSITRIFWISSSWDYLHFLFMRKIKRWLYFAEQNKTKKTWNITYSESNCALGHSTTSWIFTDCDNSLVSIIKSENFRTGRYQHQVYYSTLEFHKNFTACFMNDSSYIIREPSIATCVSKDSKQRPEYLKWPKAKFSAVSEKRFLGFSGCHYSQREGDACLMFLERIHYIWRLPITLKERFSNSFVVTFLVKGLNSPHWSSMTWLACWGSHMVKDLQFINTGWEVGGPQSFPYLYALRVYG